MDVEQILAFRLARSGLAARRNVALAEAVECPASDFSRHAALLAVAARAEGVTREGFDAAVDSGELVVAYVIRGAIHALAPGDFALYGRALVSGDEDELAAQLGRQVRKLAAEKRFAVVEALGEVAEATGEALKAGPLDKTELHEALRRRVREDLLPWCRGCQSHHVAPMLWRYATIAAGARLDSQRRYVLGKPGAAPDGAEAVRRFLRFYGPSDVGEFADWAGLAKPHARRLWNEVEDLVDVGPSSALAEDAAALESPPAAEGVRLLPPGDPYLQKTNRPLLAPDAELRKRLFRPVASPGAVLEDGRLAGLWRATMKNAKLELTVEKLTRFPRADLEEEAQRMAELRGAEEVAIAVA